MVRYLAVSDKTDTEDVSEASHLEALKPTKLTAEERPAFRAEEEGWECCHLEDSSLRLGGDLGTSVEDSLEAPEAV